MPLKKKVSLSFSTSYSTVAFLMQVQLDQQEWKARSCLAILQKQNILPGQLHRENTAVICSFMCH